MSVNPGGEWMGTYPACFYKLGGPNGVRFFSFLPCDVQHSDQFPSSTVEEAGPLGTKKKRR